MLTRDSLPRVQQALCDADLDGWLLYDFHGNNPVAVGVLGLEGLVTRRLFVWIPRRGAPTALVHRIEHGSWQRTWPREWHTVTYSGWRELEAAIPPLVRGARLAMEYSAGDAVPVLDRVPAGVIELVRAAGARVVSSGELVSRFYACWSGAQLASHRRAAERVAAIAHDAIVHAGARAASQPLSEYALQRWILDCFGRAGLETDHGPIVGVGPNAADPHYVPIEGGPRTRSIAPGDVLLVDLWAREPGGVFADQTWMATLGAPEPRVIEVWNAVRDARDTAVALLRERCAAGRAIRGADVDDAARALVTERGFGAQFVHRTGHSIDARDLHGSGPNIDDFETREERLLIPGVAFSIEPGVYLTGSFGVRSEVNAYIDAQAVIVTPTAPQQDLIVV